MNTKIIRITTLSALFALKNAQGTECPVVVPLCGERSKLCPHKRCTQPDGKCNRKGDGCLDIRWNRDVCVDPANKCGKGFCGTPPDFSDCYCENDTCIVKVQSKENATADDAENTCKDRASVV